MKNRVSIIVPVYNSENTLRRCVESILCQTYDNIQVILVDDGSTDESGKICDMYKKLDGRVAVIHKKNEGVSMARNTGLSAVNGGYVAYVDADDYVAPTFIEYMLKILQDNRCDISVCNYSEHAKCDNQKEVVSVYDTFEEKIEHLISDKNIENYLWNKLFKTRLFQNFRFEKYKAMEDFDAMYHLFESANRIAVSNQTLYYYIQNDMSLSHEIGADAIINSMIVRDKRYSDLKNKLKNNRVNKKDYCNNMIQLLFLASKRRDNDISEYVDRNINDFCISNEKGIFMSLTTKNKIKYLFVRLLKNKWLQRQR